MQKTEKKNVHIHVGESRIIAKKTRPCPAWTKGIKYEVYKETMTNWNISCYSSENEKYHWLLVNMKKWEYILIEKLYEWHSNTKNTWIKRFQSSKVHRLYIWDIWKLILKNGILLLNYKINLRNI